MMRKSIYIQNLIKHINCETLRKYLNNKITPKCKYKNLICEYVNQQPSHKNSDKSIVEGSTTNE